MDLGNLMLESAGISVLPPRQAGIVQFVAIAHKHVLGLSFLP